MQNNKFKFAVAASILTIFLSIAVVFGVLKATDKDDKKETNTTQVVEKTAVLEIVIEDESLTYNIKFSEGAKAFETLKTFDSQNENFSFEYVNDPSFGAYVTAFNGKSAGSDEFWSFYVNGTMSNLGISSYELKANDKLTFKLEKFN